MKDWLPITVRNRVALGFAVLALVIFVTWNFLPDPPQMEDIVATELWPELFSPYSYVIFFTSPDIDGFRAVAASMCVILNGLLMLAIVPCWKIIHASNYIRVPLAVLNLVGGLMVIWYVGESFTKQSESPYEMLVLLLIALSMLTLSAALFIFKNELGLRNEREVEGLMEGSDRAQKLFSKMDKLPEFQAVDRMSRDETHER